MKRLVFILILVTGLILTCSTDDAEQDPSIKAYILVSSITPPELSVLDENDIIEAVLQYKVEEDIVHSGDYRIIIYFKTINDGHLITGSNPYIYITAISDIIKHTYTVYSMDINNGNVEKPYEIFYSLEKNKGTYWEIIAETNYITYQTAK